MSRPTANDVNSSAVKYLWDRASFWCEKIFGAPASYNHHHVCMESENERKLLILYWGVQSLLRFMMTNVPQPIEHSCTPGMKLLYRSRRDSLESAAHVQRQSPLASDVSKICAGSKPLGQRPGSKYKQNH